MDGSLLHAAAARCRPTTPCGIPDGELPKDLERRDARVLLQRPLPDRLVLGIGREEPVGERMRPVAQDGHALPVREQEIRVVPRALLEPPERLAHPPRELEVVLHELMPALVPEEDVDRRVPGDGVAHLRPGDVREALGERPHRRVVLPELPVRRGDEPRRDVIAPQVLVQLVDRDDRPAAPVAGPVRDHLHDHRHGDLLRTLALAHVLEVERDEWRVEAERRGPVQEGRVHAVAVDPQPAHELLRDRPVVRVLPVESRERLAELPDERTPLRLALHPRLVPPGDGAREHVGLQLREARQVPMTYSGCGSDPERSPQFGDPIPRHR
jgi:hypothetical protein